MCYARLCSAIATIGVQLKSEEIPHIDYSSLWEPPWCDVLRLMARYPSVTKSAFRAMEPTAILSHLFQIVEEVTSCIDEADEDESGGEGSSAGSKYAARAVLYECVRQIFENGMKLLGITPICQ
jgi:arginyl-tRNA synthetase